MPPSRHAAPRHAAARPGRGRRTALLTALPLLALVGGGALVTERVVDDGVSTTSSVARDEANPEPESVQRAAEQPAVPPRQRIAGGVTLEKAPPLREKVEEVAAEPVAVAADFTIGTLNILGSNHTPPGSGWANGRTRAGWAADVVRARGIEVVGFQEVQDDQIPVLASRLPGYTVWPQQALGGSGNRLQIGWRSDLFELVDTGSISTVFSTQMRPIPYVQLRHLESGLTFHVVTLHNSPRDLEGERDSATGAQISLFGQLLGTGLPLLVTGDTNESAEFFCRVGAATGMVAANGGSTSGGCVLPPAPTGLDWVMGGNLAGFSGYVRAALPQISDHPIVYSDVAIEGTVEQ